MESLMSMKICALWTSRSNVKTDECPLAVLYKGKLDVFSWTWIWTRTYPKITSKIIKQQWEEQNNWTSDGCNNLVKTIPPWDISVFALYYYRNKEKFTVMLSNAQPELWTFSRNHWEWLEYTRRWRTPVPTQPQKTFLHQHRSLFIHIRLYTGRTRWKIWHNKNYFCWQTDDYTYNRQIYGKFKDTTYWRIRVCINMMNIDKL